MPRKRLPRDILPPFGCDPVADGTDPEFGPWELPPTPGAECAGSVYLVGIEHELWTCFHATESNQRRRGWIRWRGPDGTELTDWELGQLCFKRGARVMRLVPRWGPQRFRANVNAPLQDMQRPPPPPPRKP